MTAAAPVAGPLGESLPGSRTAGRARLAGLAFMALAWLAPWAEMQTADGGTWLEVFAQRAGAIGAACLVALWGLSATVLVARTPQGLRVGAAATDAAVALAVGLLLAARHAWIPGGDVRATWIPIFVPLALLGALDAGVQAHAARPSTTISLIRGGAAIFAAATLAVDAEWLPAGIALWLGASPLILARTSKPGAARLATEGMILVAAVVAILSPRWTAAGAGASTPVSELVLTRWVWTLSGACVAFVALLGMRAASATD